MFKRWIIGGLLVVLAVALAATAWLGGGSQKSKTVSKEKAKIGIIHVDGVIVGGRGQGGWFGEYGGTDQVMKQLREAGEDASIKAVVLRINSPGGSAPASQEVGEEIKKLRATGKIVVTSMGDVAASGGYWLAACTDKIYANPATMTGSIGVYMPYANWEELYQKIGIRQEKIKSGPHKDILSPERAMTAGERAILQAMVDDMYQQFVEVVAEGRRMDPVKVRQLADGRIYTGNQAKQNGLVDELGNLYDAIDGAAQLAGLEGKPEVKELGKASTWQMLTGGAEQRLLGQWLQQQTRHEWPMMAPVAMPAQWQVE